jgi:hypothetical protein
MQIFRLLRFGCSLLLLASLVRAHRDTYAPVTSDDLLGQQRSEVQPLRESASPSPASAEEGDGAAFMRPIIRPQPERQPGDGFQWEPALRQSVFFLGIMHAWRIATEPGTRAELRGPFFRDYVAAIKGLHGWGDGDPFIVNYVGHPFQGAVHGYIQIQNDPRYQRLEFANSRAYWTSRLRAMAFAAAASTQFELGPVSEATIGNVGKNRMGAGAVDLVVTPLGGLGVLVLEDFLDRYVVRGIERWTRNPVLRAVTRGILNPNRSFANLMRKRVLWHRDSRPGVLEP